MSLTDSNGGLSAADVAAVMGNNGNGMGWGGDGAWWLVVLFLFALSGNGFGNGFGGNGGYSGEMQRGFDQQSVMGGINGLTNAISTGFANAEVSRCNGNTNILQALNAISMAQQNCCCENRAATADLKYTVASEAATTRAANQANTQAILDKLCQLEMDGIKQNYENRISGMQNQIDMLRASLTAAQNSASQTAQTAKILADNAAQTVALEQYLNPTPIPAYMVQNPNCCPNTYNGCGCAS